MDRILEHLSSYVTGLRYHDLPVDVVHAAKRTIIDSLGCAFGAYDSEPARIGRRLASAVLVDDGATVIGSVQRTTPELAAYCNGTMIRYLDYNDNYYGVGGGGHPSDFIAAILSAAEHRRATGHDVIAGLIVTYELFCRMVDAAVLHTTAWDYYITMGAMASAGGAAKVLGLSSKQVANAISLGLVANCALFESRVGDVSMWKACASGNAARNGIFAAILADAGVTGPPAVFEGRKGFGVAVGRKFDPPIFGGAGRRFAILECGIKRYPCGSFSQTAVDAAIQLSRSVAIDDVETLEIGTHTIAKMVMGDAEKWRPTSRESADHSLPYVVGVALMTGEVTVDSFTKYLGDPALAALLPRITVVIDQECEQAVPDASMTRINITTRSGERHTAAVRYHLGHEQNPMSDRDLEEKFRAQVGDSQPPGFTDKLLERLWNLEEVTDTSQVLALTRVAYDQPHRDEP